MYLVDTNVIYEARRGTREAVAWLRSAKPSTMDGLIAATAIVHGLILVTRNVADFNDTSVPIVNPWDRG